MSMVLSINYTQATFQTAGYIQILARGLEEFISFCQNKARVLIPLLLSRNFLIVLKQCFIYFVDFIL